MARFTPRLVMILIFCCVATAPVLAGDSGLTTGDFLHRVALARQLNAVDGADAERLLRETGVRLPTLTLNERLTEGTVVTISRSLGVQVTTSRPDAPFESSSMIAFLDLVAAQAPTTEQSATGGESGPYPRPNDQAADPRTKGKGKKKGLPPVSDPSPI